MAQFWLARIDSTYVAASVELLFKDRIYGWYSGVDRAYASEASGELLMWRVLEQGSMDGYKTYDFGGRADRGSNMVCEISKLNSVGNWLALAETPVSTRLFYCV